MKPSKTKSKLDSDDNFEEIEIVKYRCQICRKWFGLRIKLKYHKKTTQCGQRYPVKIKEARVVLRKDEIPSKYILKLQESKPKVKTESLSQAFRRGTLSLAKEGSKKSIEKGNISVKLENAEDDDEVQILTAEEKRHFLQEKKKKVDKNSEDSTTPGVHKQQEEVANVMQSTMRTTITIRNEKSEWLKKNKSRKKSRKSQWSSQRCPLCWKMLSSKAHLHQHLIRVHKQPKETLPALFTELTEEGNSDKSGSSDDTFPVLERQDTPGVSAADPYPIIGKDEDLSNSQAETLSPSPPSITLEVMGESYGKKLFSVQNSDHNRREVHKRKLEEVVDEDPQDNSSPSPKVFADDPKTCYYPGCGKKFRSVRLSLRHIRFDHENKAAQDHQPLIGEPGQLGNKIQRNDQSLLSRTTFAMESKNNRKEGQRRQITENMFHCFGPKCERYLLKFATVRNRDRHIRDVHKLNLVQGPYPPRPFPTTPTTSAPLLNSDHLGETPDSQEESFQVPPLRINTSVGVNQTRNQQSIDTNTEGILRCFHPNCGRRGKIFSDARKYKPHKLEVHGKRKISRKKKSTQTVMDIRTNNLQPNDTDQASTSSTKVQVKNPKLPGMEEEVSVCITGTSNLIPESPKEPKSEENPYRIQPAAHFETSTATPHPETSGRVVGPARRPVAFVTRIDNKTSPAVPPVSSSPTAESALILKATKIFEEGMKLLEGIKRQIPSEESTPEPPTQPRDLLPTHRMQSIFPASVLVNTQTELTVPPTVNHEHKDSMTSDPSIDDNDAAHEVRVRLAESMKKFGSVELFLLRCVVIGCNKQASVISAWNIPVCGIHREKFDSLGREAGNCNVITTNDTPSMTTGFNSPPVQRLTLTERPSLTERPMGTEGTTVTERSTTATKRSSMTETSYGTDKLTVSERFYNYIQRPFPNNHPTNIPRRNSHKLVSPTKLCDPVESSVSFLPAAKLVLNPTRPSTSINVKAPKKSITLSRVSEGLNRIADSNFYQCSLPNCWDLFKTPKTWDRHVRNFHSSPQVPLVSNPRTITASTATTHLKTSETTNSNRWEPSPTTKTKPETHGTLKVICPPLPSLQTLHPTGL